MSMENATLSSDDGSLMVTISSHQALTSVWTIRTLYPIIGGYALLSSLSLLVFFIKDIRKAHSNSRTPVKEDSADSDHSKISAKRKTMLVSLMAAMFFIYVGMEVAFGSFISIFAVKSSLHFSRADGSLNVSTNVHSIISLH